MKKRRFLTMTLAAVMAASMGTTVLAAPAKTAVASRAKVAVNGVEIAPTAYTIDGYTFFKLRDVAAAVANTAASFDVAWDATAGKIALHSGISYAGAMEAGQKTTGEKAATLSTAPVLVNGKEVKMEAYNIDGFTFFKLRDLGDATGFEVTWNEAAKMIGINSPVMEDVELTDEELAALEDFYAELEQAIKETEGLEEELENLFPMEDEIDLGLTDEEAAQKLEEALAELEQAVKETEGLEEELAQMEDFEMTEEEWAEFEAAMEQAIKETEGLEEVLEELYPM